MPFGNFARDQWLLDENGKYMLIGGPTDADVKRVTEICAWIVQGLLDGNDAAATEMADVAGDEDSKLLLFRNIPPKPGAPTPIDDGSLERAWRLDDRGPTLKLIKEVALDNGQIGEVELEQIAVNDTGANEWRLLVGRKGSAAFIASAPALAVAIAKAETVEDMQRVEQWAQTVNVVLAPPEQRDIVRRLFPETAQVAAMSGAGHRN